MGWDGFVQVLCKNGHYFTEDYYIYSDYEGNWVCPYCQEKEAWHNIVDTTNCCTVAPEYRTKEKYRASDCMPWEDIHDPEKGCHFGGMGYKKLEKLTEEEVCICDKCGARHISKHETYKVPGKEK